MRLKILPLIALLSLTPSPAQGVIFSLGGGYGQTTMQNESAYTEGPLAATMTVETLLHSGLAVGVEHLRSLTPGLISSAAFTGLFGRYYFNSAPAPSYGEDQLSTHVLSFKQLAYFAGLGLGLGQSSRLPDADGLSSNASGAYLSPRLGLDYQAGEHIGLRAEGIYLMSTFGKGSLSLISIGASVYWIF